MRKIVSTLILFFLLLATIVKAQIKERTQFTPPAAKAPILKPQVQKVVLGVDSLQPSNVYFAAYIISTGFGMVHYQWVITPPQSSPAPPAPHLIKDSIMLSGTGKDKVFHIAHLLNYSTMSIKMETLTPNAVSSNIEHY